MFDQEQFNSFKEAVNQAKSIIIALPPDPDTDVLAAGLALYFSLSQTKSSIEIGCSSPVKVPSASISGIDKIQNSIGNQNLVVSFDYPENKLDKIDYEKTEDGNIRLLVKPRSGEAAPKQNSIKFSYSGANADLTFVIGVQSLKELGRLYSEEKAFFDTANIVSLNLSPNPSSYAKYSFHAAQSTSLAEIVAFILKNSSLNLTSEAATNLLFSITQATQNFTSPKTSPDTFEIVAFLLRQGARRQPSLPQTSPFPSPLRPSPTLPLPSSPPSAVPSDWQTPKIFRSQNKNVPSSNSKNNSSK